MNKLNVFCFSILLFSVLFLSCDISYFDREIEDFSWEGSTTVPVGHIKYTVSELFEELSSDDLEVVTNSDNIVSFVYERSLTSSNNSSFDVEIEDQTITDFIDSPIKTELESFGGVYTLPAGSPLIGDRTKSEVAVKDLELSQDLTSVDFSGGTLTITMVSDFDSDTDLTFVIPSLLAKSDNQPYTRSFVLGANETKMEAIPLNLYNSDFTVLDPDTGDRVNNFSIEMIAVFKFREGNNLASTDRISYDAFLSDATTEVIRGDFKQESFNVDDETISLDFLEDLGTGLLEFSNPTLTLSASNSYGFPIGINLSNIEARGKTSIEQLTYTGSAVENTFIIDSGTYMSPSAVAVNTTEIIDSNNSNLVDFLRVKPTQINLILSGNSNPINEDPNLNFFATLNSDLNVDVTLDLPLDVKFRDLVLEKEESFDNNEDLDDLVDVSFNLSVKNKIPLSGNIELEFQKNGTALDVSRIVTNFEAADTFDENGRITVAKNTISKLPFTPDDILEIKKATDVKLLFTLNTPTDGAVKLFEDYTISIVIGAKAKVKITLDDD